MVAGGLHVLSGPDHLAAVAPLAVQGESQAWRPGFRWGLGHSGGVLTIGLLSLLLRGVLPTEWLSSWAERTVGVVLLGIGIWGLRRALRSHLHTHLHSHGGPPHVHIHVHDPLTAHAPAEVPRRPTAHTHSHAAFWVGTLHGVAGTSHFLGVLPALAFPTWEETVAYLLAYGVGTVLAMSAFSSAMGWLGRFGAARSLLAYRGLLFVCSGSAICVGMAWLFL